MAEIKTKFSIGDTVYRAGTTTVQKRHDCPDCLGSRKWEAKSPAGGIYEFTCPRCGGQYRSEDALTLDYREFAPHVDRLTIGSVRTDSHDNRPVTYMCRETGVGSGSVYDENILFATPDEATKAAEGIAAGQNVSVPWVAKRYSKTLELSDYQLENALIKHARNEQSRHSSRLQMLFEDLREADTPDRIKEVLDGFTLREEAA